MKRRDLLKSLGAATAIALLPREDALAAWARVAARRTSASGFTAQQLALIGAIADTILPRTNSPSATDVRVPEFVDVIVSENYADAARASFVTGLDTLDAALRSPAGVSFAEQDPEHRAVAIGEVERLRDRRTDPASIYWRLKGLVIHGYFTSEPVMKGVLKFEMMPGRFDGAAPVMGS